MWIGDTNKLSSINYFSADSLNFFENPDPIQHLFINSFGNDLKIILQIRKKIQLLILLALTKYLNSNMQTFHINQILLCCFFTSKK